MSTSCGGMGPWFVALLFNTSDECKKQTHLLAHTMPHLASDVLNKTDSDDCWIIIIKVGPFEIWDDCVAYLNLWTSRTRGRLRRLERGVEIFRMYANKLGLTFWYQTQSKEHALEQHKSYKTSKKVITHQESGPVITKKRSSDQIIHLNDAESIFCNNVPLENLTLAMIKSVQLKKVKVNG
jgi:hypothetical protein